MGEEWSCDRTGEGTYPGNAKQLDLAVGEEEGEADVRFPLKVLQVGVVHRRLLVLVRGGRLGGSGLCGHGGGGSVLQRSVGPREEPAGLTIWGEK